MNNLEKYNEVFCKTFDVSELELNENFKFQIISKWDSVSHMNLISEIEDVFDIMFEMDDMIDFNSYEKGKKLLKKYNIVI